MWRCYLCGKEMLPGEATKDHVIPDCFYATADRTKDNLPTAKAHSKCNEDFGIIENYLRDCYLFKNSPASYQEQNAALKRKYEEYPKYKKIIMDSVSEVECYLESGKSLGKRIIHPSAMEFHDLLTRKMARGLVFIYKLKDGRKEIIPQNVPIRVVLMPNDGSFDHYSSFSNVVKVLSFDKVWRFWGWVEPDMGDCWNGIVDVILFDSIRFQAFIGQSSMTIEEDHVRQSSQSNLVRLCHIGYEIIGEKLEKIYAEIPDNMKAGPTLVDLRRIFASKRKP